jgi:hypothetical protein
MIIFIINYFISKWKLLCHSVNYYKHNQLIINNTPLHITSDNILYEKKNKIIFIAYGSGDPLYEYQTDCIVGIGHMLANKIFKKIKYKSITKQYGGIVSLCTLDDLFKNLLNNPSMFINSTIVIIASTYLGEPPFTAKKAHTIIRKMRIPDKTISDIIKTVNVNVFGLGNAKYGSSFAYFPKMIHNWFNKMNPNEIKFKILDFQLESEYGNTFSNWFNELCESL